jgi:hypothetical protein
VIEQPVPRQVSYGLVTGRAPRGAAVIVVSANGRILAVRALRGRRFWLRVNLPTGDVAVRVQAVAAGGRRSARVVRDVYGLPAMARPRAVRGSNDARLARQLRGLSARYRGTCGFYVQSLTSGAGAAWNAKARFPAASTLKLAIAVTVLSRHSGVPPPGSRLDALLREMIVPSDDAAANELLVWLGGSTSSGALHVNALMRSLGLVDSLMYGGYETSPVSRAPAGGIPVRLDRQPPFGVGKYTTAWDMTSLWRALWLATESRGRLHLSQPGLTRADARYLFWLLAHVHDSPKLDAVVSRSTGVAVLHKAGWISAARHDTGLVFWRGGVFVAGVMTWDASGAGPASDRLAARIAAAALARFRAVARRG